MDESDSDDEQEDLSPTIEDGAYPLEGKFKNAQDRDEILALPMVQREQILADREEEQMQKRREQQLKNLMGSSAAADKSRKRKADAQLEDDERRPARAKTTREKALDTYKATREQARDGTKRRTMGRSSRRSRSRSEASSRDASGSPDIQARPTAPSRENDLPVDLEDMEHMRMGRSRLAEACFKPKFDDSMPGATVRVCIGQNADRQNEYRMTVVKSVVTGTPYLVDAEPAIPKFYTDQYLMLAHGKSQKQWSIMHCSDSKFTEREFNRWKQQLAVTDNMPLITKGDARKTLDNLHALADYRMTNEDVNNKVARREKFAHLFASSPTVVKKTETEDRAEKLRLRNEKIRRENSEQIRKVQMEQKAKSKAFMLKAAAEKRAALAASKANGNDSLAPPKNDIDALFSEGSEMGSRAASPAVGSPAPMASGTATPQKSKTGRFTKMATDDDFISGMDLAIDIEI